MTRGREGKYVTLGSFLRKELPDRAEDRSEFFSQDLTPLSSVAYGATPFLRKGAKYCGESRHHNPQPEGLSNLEPSGQRPVKLQNPQRRRRCRRGATTTLNGEAAVKP